VNVGERRQNQRRREGSRRFFLRDRLFAFAAIATRETRRFGRAVFHLTSTRSPNRFREVRDRLFSLGFAQNILKPQRHVKFNGALRDKTAK
jgi:hypothetical protein